MISRHIKGSYPATTIRLLCGYLVSEEVVVSSLDDLRYRQAVFILGELFYLVSETGSDAFSVAVFHFVRKNEVEDIKQIINPYPTAFPYGNGMVLHFYQQQESSTTKTVHKVINKRLKTYV